MLRYLRYTAAFNNATASTNAPCRLVQRVEKIPHFTGRPINSPISTSGDEKLIETREHMAFRIEK